MFKLWSPFGKCNLVRQTRNTGACLGTLIAVFLVHIWYVHDNNGILIPLVVLYIFDNSWSSTSRSVWKYVRKGFAVAHAAFVYLLGIPPSDVGPENIEVSESIS